MGTIEFVPAAAKPQIVANAFHSGLAHSLIGNPDNPVRDACASQRFVVAGSPAMRADGSLDDGIEAQMQGAWQNLFAVMKAAGYEKHHLRNTTILMKVGGQTQLFRRVRDRMLQRMPVPSSCLHVSELETGAACVELEGVVSKD